MEFTREAWENAPEGATVQHLNHVTGQWATVHVVGFTKRGFVVAQSVVDVFQPEHSELRIILPKRKVTVQLWRTTSGRYQTSHVEEGKGWYAANWTLLGEHTFEIEGE